MGSTLKPINFTITLTKKKVEGDRKVHSRTVVEDKLERESNGGWVKHL